MRDKAIVSIVVATLIASLIAGCSSQQAVLPSSAEGSAFLPSVIVSYQQSSTVTSSLTYDDNGNLTGLTEARVSGSGTHVDIATGESIEYDSKTTTDNYTIELDSEGYPSIITYWQNNSYNGTEKMYAESSVQTDEAGRIVEYTQTPLEGAVGILDLTMKVQYRENGIPSSLSTTFSGFTSAYKYDEDGWRIHGQTVGGSTGATDTEYTLVEDASGIVKGVQYPAIGGGSGSYTFDYDDSGNISTVYLNGDIKYEIDYVEIDQPSASARAFSMIKNISGDPLDWVPLML